MHEATAPLAPDSTLFTGHPSCDLHIGTTAPRGLGVIAPMPLGVALDTVEDAVTQREFLRFIAEDSHLVAFDQRGAGGSGPLPSGCTSDVLGADVWRVADAVGLERVILYGVFDAGLTVIEAARRQPERVLGIVLNFTPPAFGRAPGVTDEVIAGWLRADETIAVDRILEALGVPQGDVAAFAAAPHASRGAAERIALLRHLDADALAQIEVPVLVIEPLRRTLFAGWADALVHLQPHARMVHSLRAAHTLGAIDAFIAALTLQHGRHGSDLTPEQAATLDAAEAAVEDVRTIVVPVDDEFSGIRAVELACRLAEARATALVIAAVQVVHRARALDDPPPEVVARSERLLRVMGAAASRHGVPFETTRQPARSYQDGVIEAARHSGAEMIVLPNPTTAGALGRGEDVLREILVRAPCEVLIDRGGRVARPDATAGGKR